jgi:PDZ domain/Caspase domain
MFPARAALWTTALFLTLDARPVLAAAADEAVRLHVILVGNTDDPMIGESVKQDLKNLEATLRAGFEKHKDRLTVKILQGEEFTLKNVRDALRDLKTDGTEAILCYFACHGTYRPGEGHLLAMEQPRDRRQAHVLLRSDLRHLLREKGARLAVLLTDTCNAYPPGIELRPLPAAPEWETMRHLFLVPRGLVDINAVSEGEVAYGEAKSGGFFSSTFVNVLREKFDKLDANKDRFVHWEELLPRMEAGSQQQYEKMRTQQLRELTDEYLKKQPEERQRLLTTRRDILLKQKTHSLRVYSLPPLARFGVRALDDEDGGAKVVRVQDDTPAAQTGLRPGDVIKRIGDHEVKDAASFLQTVDQSKGEVSVEVQRGNVVLKMKVRLAPWPVPGREG